MSITSLNLSGHSNDLICFQYEPLYNRFTALAAPALLLSPPLKFLEVFHPRTLPSVSVYPSSQKYSRLSMSISIGSRHDIETVFRYALVLDVGRLAYE